MITYKKIHWFYEVFLNGECIGSVQLNNDGKWQGQRNNWLYFGKTRKQVVNDMIHERRNKDKDEFEINKDEFNNFCKENNLW